ncbi:MAG: hypothetical protein GXY38_06020 [Planctomycetes bacterium]|jgi:flavin-dependent dehydrogenase|nr:hypothetical protein [Planctomycetota bacterium]
MIHLYDIAVLGATPAGCAAASYLARKKADVVLIDAPGGANESPLMDWAPRDFFSLRGLPRDMAKACKAKPFKNVRYYDAMLARQVDYTSRATAGYCLKPSVLIKSLTANAIAAGAKTVDAGQHPAIGLSEDMVTVIGKTQVRAKVLLVAQSNPAEVMSDLAMPTRPSARTSFVVAALDVPLGDAKHPRLDNMMHIVESKERSELGMFFVYQKTLHLRVVSSSVATGTRAQELSTLLGGLQREGILPATLSIDKAKGAVWFPPAGEALEMETHVAKRCLLAGTAGGFADTITGQTLSPSVRSAIIACDVAMEALKGGDLQNTLGKFKSEWRSELAESLRPPSTSLHMLLPLLFVNNRIVAKFTGALLHGEPI